jgi:alkylation response protein AidB-like acyl-CoA dehydrogenase
MQFGWPIEFEARIKEARQFATENLCRPRQEPGFDGAGFRVAAGFGAFKDITRRAGTARCNGALATVAMLEAMGRGGAARSLLFAMGAHLFGCTVPLLTYGTPAQTVKWGERLQLGEIVGALAVTEAGGGSSLDNIRTEAVEAPGGFNLTGEKTLIGNAPVASLFIVLARHAGQTGPLGLTAFLVPAGTEGLGVSAPAATSGLKDAPLGDVRMERCFVATDSILGRVGAGLRVFTTALQWERSCLLAGFLGAAERDLAQWVDALEARRDGDGSVLRHQAVSHRLARTRLELEGARLLLYRAAWSIDQGREDYAMAAMAKLAVSEAVVAAAETGVRLMAGHGWYAALPNPAAALADTLGGLLASGTSEIQLEILARHLRTELKAS